MYELSVDDYAFLFDEFYGGKSLREIVYIFRRKRGLPITSSTVWRRIVGLTPYMLQAVRHMLRYEWHPEVGKIWEIDGTLLEGVPKWLIVVRDIKTCMPLSWITSDSEDAKSSENALSVAIKVFRTIPETLRMDGSKAFPKAARKVLKGRAQAKIIPRIGRTGQNQSIEGFFSELEAWMDSKRGLHSKKHCSIIIDGWMLYYSFVKPCPTLNSLTPAEAAGVNFGWFGKWNALVKLGFMFKNGKLGRKTKAVNKKSLPNSSIVTLDKYMSPISVTM